MSGVHRSARISDARATGQVLPVLLHARILARPAAPASPKIEPFHVDQ